MLPLRHRRANSWGGESTVKQIPGGLEEGRLERCGGPPTSAAVGMTPIGAQCLPGLYNTVLEAIRRCYLNPPTTSRNEISQNHSGRGAKVGFLSHLQVRKWGATIR